MDRQETLSWLAHTAIFAAAGLTVTLLLLLGAALLISVGTLPETRFYAAAAISAGAGALITGILTGRRAGRRIVPAGLGAGCIFLALLFLLSALFFSNLRLGGSFFPICAAVLAGTALGAALAALRRG